VENASMPRAEELPDKLKPLTRYNAISISDDRWKTDVERLAKIISFEIPSASERRLYWVRLGISVALFASLSLIAGIHTWAAGKSGELLWVSIPFMVIISSSLLLLSIINLIDVERKRFIHASIASGAIGSLLFFTFFLIRGDSSATYFGAILVGTLMFAFMNISGFKAK